MRRLVRKLVFSLLPLFILLFAGEFACRVKFYRLNENGLPYLLAPFLWQNKEDVVNLPRPIKRTTPNNSVIFSPCQGRNLPRSWHEVNGFMWRGRPFSAAKAPGVYRIMTVGGSSVESQDSPDDDTWSCQLEDMLNADSSIGRKVEVINGGKVAYNSESVYYHLLRDGFPLNPDMIVYYAAYNDVSKGLIDKSIGILGRSTFGWLHRRLYYSSMLYTYLVQKWHYMSAARLFTDYGESNDKISTLLQTTMKRIIDECRARSVRFVYVRQVIDYPLQVDGRDMADPAVLKSVLADLVSGKLRRPEADKFPQIELKQRLINAIQTDFCRSLGIPIIDPLPAIDLARSGDRKIFVDIVHMNCFAEKVLAREICTGLAPIIAADTAAAGVK